MLKLILGTTLTLLAAACAAVPAYPSTASSSPSAEPPAPLGEGSPTASATGDGFVVELWLDRGGVRLGDRLHALVRVTNAGDAAPMWETNTCFRGPAALKAVVAGGLPAGQDWDGLAGEFKELALLEAGVESTGQAAVGEFVIAQFVDRDAVPCDAMSIMRRFVPGQVEQEWLAWDVVPKVGLTIPSGELTLAATFASDLGEVTAEATVRVEADDVPILTLVDYIDAALSEPSFRQWVEAHPRDGWLNTTITFWPNTEGQMPQFPPYTRARAGAVDVGLFADATGQGFAGMVVLERSTAEVLGTRFE